MKKFIAMLLALAMVLSLAACGSKTDAPAETKAQTAAEKPAATEKDEEPAPAATEEAVSEDKEEIKNYEIIVPGFVYDYKDDSFNYIYGGHDKYLNSKVYTYGVEKRNYALDTYSGDFFD